MTLSSQLVADLKALYEQNKDTHDEYLKRIVERKFAYPNDLEKSKYMVIGFNPSYRADDIKLDYSWDDAKNKYFNSIKKLIPDKSNKSDWRYLDLFYYRETKQRNIQSLIEKGARLNFICEQLAITMRLLEEISPKLIIVCSKGAQRFFGFNMKDGFNIWMGYHFELTESKGLYKIIGVDNKESVGKEYLKDSETRLKGTQIYFLRSLRFLKREKIEEFKKEIEKVTEGIE